MCASKEVAEPEMNGGGWSNRLPVAIPSEFLDGDVPLEAAERSAQSWRSDAYRRCERA